MAVDKAALLVNTTRETTQEIELPSGVGTVVVRGLTRKEALTAQGELSEEEAERKLLSIALVDPPMTEDEIEQWQQVCAAGELVPVMETVLQMSGMTATAPKESIKSFRS